MTSALFFNAETSAFSVLYGGIFMFFSLAIILLFGLLLGGICKKLRLPSLIGMLAVGIIIGPYALNLIDTSILEISAQLRKIALIIILARAGLSLNVSELKKVGRPAIMMCFVPACFEIIGMIFLAPKLLGISVVDAVVMGTVVGAVSPAVIVPKMLNLIENGYGKDKSIPQLILAGASVDDVFVIVLFSAFLGLSQTGDMSAVSFVKIPISIVLGITVGIFVGIVLGKFFAKAHIRDTVKIIILMCVSFLLVAFEDTYGGIVPFSSLITVMCIGISLQKVRKEATERLSQRYNKLWVVAEILLFVLVGASVNIDYALKAGVAAIILIFLVLLFRMFGVFICMLKTNLNLKERLFCMIAYLPKATVKAAIGGIPLSMGLNCGETVLTVAVLSIIITAPLGAFLIDLTYKKLLTKNTLQKQIKLYNCIIFYFKVVLFMNVTLKRDGLTLRGELLKPDVEKCPILIIFHGFMANIGKDDKSMFYQIAHECLNNGIATIRFDFDGHGDSDGEFCDMNVLSEILDAAKIIDYVRGLDFVTEINILGHSQGALVGGMMAGYYRECISKLIMLAPAATIKDDSLIGSCFGTPYDMINVPDKFPVKDNEGNHYEVGGMYFRVARTLPIYETTSMFCGKTLIIHGTADDAVGVIGSRRYKECMPHNTELVLIEGEGHGLDNSLDDIKKRVIEFLKK